ncbi:MAG: hypothetical protein HY515_04600 [Candidatus Aenigmarchaeota archaeon]|nr:hypothetical protein [Candidatus Aenigmarchaeota archaeon]
MANQPHVRESFVTVYNRRVGQSPGYRSRIDSTKTYLRDQLLLTEEEVTKLDIEERFRLIPFQLVVRIATAHMSHEFQQKYGYIEIDPGKIAKDVEDLEYGRVPKESMTPVQHEYISLWAGKLKDLFSEIEQEKRRFTEEKKESDMNDRMNELFRNG